MSQQEPIPQRGLKSRKKDIRATTSGRSFFFGVGINAYHHFPDLNNAVKDVQQVMSLLQQKYDIEGADTLLLTNEEASRKQIITAFDQLKEQLATEDKLIIYFSGHGHLDKWGKGYWIPVDAELDNSAEYIRNSTILEYIGDIPAQHILLISDACFSGSLFYRGQHRSSLAVDEMEQRKSRWAICSGRHDEEVADGAPGEHSPFAKSILYILQQNNRAKLNVSRLTEQVLEMTRANYRQLPEGSPLQGVDHRGGQYVFRLKGTEDDPAERIQMEVSETVSTPTRNVFAHLSSERKEVFQWLKKMGLYQLVATLLLVGAALFITEGSGLGQLLLVLIPLVYYLAAYFPAVSSRLNRKNLLILTGAYALIFYALLLLWKLKSPDTNAWWQFLLLFVIGGILYYFLIPLLSKRNY